MPASPSPSANALAAARTLISAARNAPPYMAKERPARRARPATGALHPSSAPARAEGRPLFERDSSLFVFFLDCEAGVIETRPARATHRPKRIETSSMLTRD